MSKISAIELIELLPTDVLSDFGQATRVDYKVHKLKGEHMFVLLLYGLLHEQRTSLRTLEDTFNSSKFKFFFGIERHLTTRYNSLSDRLASMQVEYFAQIYEFTYKLFTRYYSAQEALRYHIRRVDTTMICEQARKLEEGMSVGRKKNGKKQVKIAVSLTDMFPSSLELFTSQVALSDDIALPVEIFKQVDTAQDNIVVFDRGVAAHSCYAQMQASQIWFVTRLKEKVRYQHISNLQAVTGVVIGNLTLLSDEQINFPRHPQLYFRLIRAQNEKGKTLSFLTNRFDLSVDEIIRCYHKRWDIEVFFRFLKQDLNLSHLISMNTNGITIILYMTMIASILLLVYKKCNQWGYKTAKRRFTIELDQYIIALIVEACGGDSSKWINLPFFNPSSEHT